MLEKFLNKIEFDSYEDLKKNYKELEIDLYLCDNQEIQKLNKEYRNIDQPTDVLSFSMLESEVNFNLPILHLGEIIISIDKLVEQAQQNKHSNLHELVYLTSHGVLHLLGLHHKTDDNYNKIVSIQNEVVSNILTNC